MLYKSLVAISVASLLASPASAAENCPLQGPSFPVPTSLCTSKAVQVAKSELAKLLNTTISSGNSTWGRFDSVNTSYSLEIFSVHDPKPLLTKHHTSASLSKSSSGARSVDSNSVYRIGSLTKLVAAYTVLFQAGEIYDDPITKYVPELAAVASSSSATGNPIDQVSWNDITVGALLAHTADIGRDYAGFRELTGPLANLKNPTAIGLPPLKEVELPVCAGGGFCTREQYFKGFTKSHPVYAPSTATIYSNAGYQILGYALENITGKSFPDLVEETIYKPLQLSSSSWRFPPSNNSTSVITNPFVWSLDLGDETPYVSLP